MDKDYACNLQQLYLLLCRFTGYSPFQGDTHNETFYYVSFCEYDFDNEVFDDVSQDAKDFIEELLQKEPRLFRIT